jgi:ketosteroid isomerase-like protein
MAERDMQGMEKLLDDFLAAYCSRNIEKVADLVANDENFVAYGTDQGEDWYGWNSFRNVTEKLFTAIVEMDWKRGKTKINFSGDGSVAWFAEELAGTFKSPTDEHKCSFRMSGVAERRADGWVIVQFHRSVPVDEYAVPYLETHGVRFD